MEVTEYFGLQHEPEFAVDLTRLNRSERQALGVNVHNHHIDWKEIRGCCRRCGAQYADILRDDLPCPYEGNVTSFSYYRLRQALRTNKVG